MAMTIQRIRQLLDSRAVSCEELTHDFLETIGRENPRLNALVRITPETALDAARAADRRLLRGDALGPLDGVPMVLKDNLVTAGIPTTCCSRMLANYVPPYDAAVWERLRAEGAVLLGKTNMDEFGMGSSGETSCCGPARNPVDTARTAGGSSGGAASAVAGGLAVYGLGSDTGGSVRQPAAFCGLVGLKPTYGALSRYGLIAYASSLDQVGVIAHTAADAALIYDRLAVRDERDETSRGRCGEPVCRSLDAPLRGRRVVVPILYREQVDTAVWAVLERTAAALRALGADVRDIALPELERALPAYYILASAEASSNLARYDGMRYGRRAAVDGGWAAAVRRSRSEGFGREVRRRILLGAFVLSEGYSEAYYRQAQRLRAAVRTSMRAVLQKADLLLMPTAPTVAFLLDRTEMRPSDRWRADLCTVPASLAGLPAVSLPCGVDADGLPVGIQLVGDAYREDLLLNVAHQLERAREECL